MSSADSFVHMEQRRRQISMHNYSSLSYAWILHVVLNLVCSRVDLHKQHNVKARSQILGTRKRDVRFSLPGSHKRADSLILLLAMANIFCWAITGRVDDMVEPGLKFNELSGNTVPPSYQSELL